MAGATRVLYSYLTLHKHNEEEPTWNPELRNNWKSKFQVDFDGRNGRQQLLKAGAYESLVPEASKAYPISREYRIWQQTAKQPVWFTNCGACHREGSLSFLRQVTCLGTSNLANREAQLVLGSPLLTRQLAALQTTFVSRRAHITFYFISSFLVARSVQSSCHSRLTLFWNTVVAAGRQQQRRSGLLD